MRDITGLMNTYREAARLLWNNFLRDPSEETEGLNPDNERYCDFEAVKRILFTSLVLREIALEDLLSEFLDGPTLMSAWQEPFEEIGIRLRHECPAMVNRETPHLGNQRWDSPVDRLDASADLRFVDYFDWDTRIHRDFRYYRVRIASFPAHPEVVGRDALVETIYGRVLHFA